MDGAYASVEDNTLVLFDSYIEPYKNGGYVIQEPRRKRRLLARKRQILNLKDRIACKGYTLIPIRLYLKNGFAKIELGVCTGKKLYDKRQAEKNKNDNKEIRTFLE